ncbi:HEPN domain-containing protein [Synergistaceae bacterium OttesenSCG-928-I11]|nr:HEPN domain-containing protein [Synergistaceae bacterium OttesenSCG-928-I11]
MTLSVEERLIVVKSYMRKSATALDDARAVLEISPRLSAHSSYESAYHIALALLVSHKIPVPRTHEGVNHKIYEQFVHARHALSRDIAKYLGQLEGDRNVAQYSLVKEITLDDAQHDLCKATEFHAIVKKLIIEELKEVEDN